MKPRCKECHQPIELFGEKWMHVNRKGMYHIGHPARLEAPANPHYNGYPVRIMAIAEGYAMVRRKGCMPFVVQVKQLTEGEPKS